MITTAAAQYANRPKDESFASMADMLQAAQSERERSKEVSYNVKDLRAIATDSEVQIASPKGVAGFSHWAFGQFARLVGAPAAYLRELPAKLAAECLNHGISETHVGATAELLVKLPTVTAGQTIPAPVVRAVTTEKYGRLWDAELYSAADKIVFSQNSVSGQPWIHPPTWSGDAAGTWRGDRDSFVIRVDGGSIVTDPSVAGDGRMYRGVMIRNSEVGAAGLLIECVLFQYICGNLNLWGAVIDKRFRRRHVGARVLRDTIRELSQLARQWSQRSASQDEAIIRGLIDRQLASTKDAVIDELRTIGYTKDQAEAAIVTCEQHFGASPLSYWGIAQGTTKNSQSAGYQDERYELDKLAALVMQRGRKLVAA